jgi:hypothetical protein
MPLRATQNGCSICINLNPRLSCRSNGYIRRSPGGQSPVVWDPSEWVSSPRTSLCWHGRVGRRVPTPAVRTIRNKQCSSCSAAASARSWRLANRVSRRGPLDELLAAVDLVDGQRPSVGPRPQRVDDHHDGAADHYDHVDDLAADYDHGSDHHDYPSGSQADGAGCQAASGGNSSWTGGRRRVDSPRQVRVRHEERPRCALLRVLPVHGANLAQHRRIRTPHGSLL